MILSEHSLRQLDESYIRSLPEVACQELAVKLLVDLKTLHERIHQNPDNSSMPPSSRLPWSMDEPGDDGGENTLETDDSNRFEPVREPIAGAERETSGEGEGGTEESSPSVKRNPGKQPGAAGHGRTQQLPITNIVEHRVLCCTGCDHQFTEQDKKVAWTGFYSIDLEIGTSGIQVMNTKHVYYDTTCPCGHVTREYPHREEDDGFWENVGLSEWRLAGPMLCAFIVSLSYRMRISRTKIQGNRSDPCLFLSSMALDPGNPCRNDGGGSERLRQGEVNDYTSAVVNKRYKI